MISKKVCMVGAFSVGKTALVRRYVHSFFSDRYLSTVGVKISKKTLTVNDTPLNLLLWDLEGQDDYYGEINTSYLRGAMGLIVVADGVRSESLTIALSVRETALNCIGPVPNLLLLNKVDLSETWSVPETAIESLEKDGLRVMKTSAKTGLNVEEAFMTLATEMLGEKP